MKTIQEIIAAAETITVVNDGQLRYPVTTENLMNWTRENGHINSKNYDQFCSDVECIGEREVGTPGNRGMIDLCEQLINAGASTESLG